MLIVICTAAAAALSVVAYSELKRRAPETATAGLEEARELAAVILVCVKAVEAVVDVLAGQRQQRATRPLWGESSGYDESESYLYRP
ncbi:hypothetical protein [Ornithinimicrobium sediminis]|uniref:hypothetical protein n=1 Tax=Ornithinimicrobium sediminis TaxID=2904603 RepID=UPI001E4C0EE4|nr:hypothetical protein [Ornithinimicrobium sediminis]MCE0488143.1 hypothetical protein [Ornithinimicrobium sediminis]